MKILSVFDKQQIRIAKDTLKMSDKGAYIMGGMTKTQSTDINATKLKTLAIC